MVETAREARLSTAPKGARLAAGLHSVIKKWLSYREHELLGRALTTDEAREVTHMARCIAAIMLLSPALDTNYLAVKQAVATLAQPSQ